MYCSIGGYVTASSRSNLLAPLVIDAAVLASQWAGGCMNASSYDALLCVNVIHISHWSVTEVCVFIFTVNCYC